jgi:mannose-1-phosphate guanylyltransferase/mannose-6-phosphate isomerase
MSTKIIPAIVCMEASSALRESMSELPRIAGPESTFEKVLACISDSDLFARPIVMASNQTANAVADQLRERCIEDDIVISWDRRLADGPAVAVCAGLAAGRDRDAQVLWLPADHALRIDYAKACRRAANAAAAGRIVVFGIQATTPDPHFIYIRPGETLSDGFVRSVEGWMEKPMPATAASYVSGGSFWYTGHFLFRASTMLQEIERFEPAMAEEAKAAVKEIRRGRRFLELNRRFFGGDQAAPDR